MGVLAAVSCVFLKVLSFKVLPPGVAFLAGFGMLLAHLGPFDGFFLAYFFALFVFFFKNLYRDYLDHSS